MGTLPYCADKLRSIAEISQRNRVTSPFYQDSCKEADETPALPALTYFQLSIKIPLPNLKSVTNQVV